MAPSLHSRPRSRSYTTLLRPGPGRAELLLEAAGGVTLPRVPARRGRRMQRAPSMASMHRTTVPQSLVPSRLGSRHAPTRSSLRHSRHMVNHRVRPLQAGPPASPPTLALAGLTQLALAAVLTVCTVIKVSVAVWPLVVDWPLYTGPCLLLSSVALLAYAWCLHRDSHHLLPDTHHKLKFASLALSASSFLFCLVAAVSLTLQLILVNCPGCPAQFHQAVLAVLIVHIITDLTYCVAFITLIFISRRTFTEWIYNPAYQKAMPSRTLLEINMDGN